LRRNGSGGGDENEDEWGGKNKTKKKHTKKKNELESIMQHFSKEIQSVFAFLCETAPLLQFQ
jgi:hypothetical protein